MSQRHAMFPAMRTPPCRSRTRAAVVAIALAGCDGSVAHEDAFIANVLELGIRAETLHDRSAVRRGGQAGDRAVAAPLVGVRGARRPVAHAEAADAAGDDALDRIEGCIVECLRTNDRGSR